MISITYEDEGEAMRETGGYLELERYNGSIFHGAAVALNCGRNCLALRMAVLETDRGHSSTALPCSGIFFDKQGSLRLVFIKLRSSWRSERNLSFRGRLARN